MLTGIIEVTAQTSQNSLTPAASAWKSIEEPAYSIQYPDSWDLDRSGTMGLSFMILSKQTSAQDLFRENVNLLIQDLAGQNINLDQFVDLSLSQVKTMLTNGNVLESKRITNKNIPFQQLLYVGEINQQQLKFKQYYWIHHGKAWVLTLTCATDQYDSYRETAEKIMDSFKLK